MILKSLRLFQGFHLFVYLQLLVPILSWYHSKDANLASHLSDSRIVLFISLFKPEIRGCFVVASPESCSVSVVTLGILRLPWLAIPFAGNLVRCFAVILLVMALFTLGGSFVGILFDFGCDYSPRLLVFSDPRQQILPSTFSFLSQLQSAYFILSLFVFYCNSNLACSTFRLFFVATVVRESLSCCVLMWISIF